MPTLLCTLSLWLAFAPAPAAAQAREPELPALVRQLVAAQSAYDPSALDRLLTSDYIEVSPVGEVDPRDKVLGFYRPDQKPPASVMTAVADVSEISVREYGETAVVLARFTYTITAKGQPAPPRSMRATLVCRREHGVWRIASAQYTSIRPTGTAPRY